MTHSQSDISVVDSNWDSLRGIHRFSHKAMATIFEVIIAHSDANYAEQAAWAAFDELDRLDAELSRFIENSDVSRINNLTANRPLQIGPAAFESLQICSRLHGETDGAFDITIGSLLDCWFNEDKTMRSPSLEQLNSAIERTGLHLIKLSESEHTVWLSADSVQIDFGGFGKGFAVDKMIQLLRDWSIDCALIHSGCSSVLAIGDPGGTRGWPVTLSNPYNRKQTLACLHLQGQALSGSGLQKGRHIIDPRTAKPVEDKIAAWACASDAATADALSTTFMIMAPRQIEQYCVNHLDTLAMVVTSEQCGKKGKILHFGPWDADDLFEKLDSCKIRSDSMK